MWFNSAAVKGECSPSPSWAVLLGAVAYSIRVPTGASGLAKPPPTIAAARVAVGRGLLRHASKTTMVALLLRCSMFDQCCPKQDSVVKAAVEREGLGG